MKNLLGKVINNENCFDASFDENNLHESGDKSLKPEFEANVRIRKFPDIEKEF